MTDGLKDVRREAIITTIAANDRVERAVLFGSRATGTNTITSDVDIALYGDHLTLTDQARLAAALDEIPMAQSVDLLLYDSIQNQTLREHIRSHGVEWYVRPRKRATLPAGTTHPRGLPSVESIYWPLVPARDLFRLTYGRALAAPVRRTGNVPVYGTNGRCGTHDTALFEGPGVVLGRKGQGPLGVEWSRGPYWVIDTAYTLTSLRQDVHLKFAYYLLKFIGLNHLKDGTSNPTLSRETFGAQALPFPPVLSQRTIAHILGTLDDKIELNRRMNTTLEAMARALFRSWFVDFDPVLAKMEGRDTGLPRDIGDLFPDRLVDSELGEIPEGWPLVPLPELIEVNPSRSLRKGEIAPYLDMANMPTCGHAPDSVVQRPFNSGMRFANGDTLVARITPCLENGKTAYVDFLRDDEIGWGSTEYIVMKPRHPLPSEFAYLLARTARFRKFAIQNMSGTSGRQRVPAAALSAFSIPSPPALVGAAFGRAAQLLLRRARAAVDECCVLANCRDALLPKLVSGELRTHGIHWPQRGSGSQVASTVGGE